MADGLVDQRKKEISRSSSGVLDGASGGPTQMNSIRCAPTVDEPIIMEGYMSKFSSGALTSRWQKRYFVLRKSKLVYYEKQSTASLTGSSCEVPCVEFPMRRIVGIEIRSTREFDLQIGRRKRRYQLRAPSDDNCKEWVSAIEELIAGQVNIRDSGGSADSMISEGSTGLIGGSSMFTGGSDDTLSGGQAAGYGLGLNSSGVFGRDFTLWEHTIEERSTVTGEELDALFSEWFSFLDDARLEIKAGRMIDAGSRAVSDLWSILGSLPRGEDIDFECAKEAINRKKPSDAASLYPLVVAQYIKRLCDKFKLWIQRGSPDDIPVLLEWSCRLRLQLNELVGESRKDEGPSWSVAWALMIRRMSTDWEVGIIEKLKRKMMDYWESSNSSSAKITIVTMSVPNFFTSVGLTLTKPLLMTAWTREFLTLVSDSCLKRGYWNVAYPTCAGILTTHAAEAIIACMNSCWRLVFKAKADLLSDDGKGGADKRVDKIISQMKQKLTRRSSVSSGGNKNIQQSVLVDESLEGMVAFGNECTLISVFCQHASAVSELKDASAAFATCMEGLSVAFANTSNDIGQSIVETHFARLKVLTQPFESKHLAVRLKVPITDSLETAQTFIAQVSSMGVHELLKYVIVGHVMQTVARTYVDSLVKHKPKMSKFTRLAQVVAEDEGLFFALFRELGRASPEINTAIDPISHIRTILSEKLDDNAAGGITTSTLVHQCVDITKIFPSIDRSTEVIKALLEVKMLSKNTRKDILLAVSTCIQRSIDSSDMSSPSIAIRNTGNQQMQP